MALAAALGIDYIYPNDGTEQRYFGGKGLTLERLPFRWERVQHERFASLSPEDEAGIRSSLDAAQVSRQRVILDLHNYGRYFDQPSVEPIGGDDPPQMRVLVKYPSRARCEPASMTRTAWIVDAAYLMKASVLRHSDYLN